MFCKPTNKYTRRMIVIVLPRSLCGHITDNRTHGCLREGQHGSLLLDSKCRLISFFMQTNHHVAWKKKRQTQVYTSPKYNKKLEWLMRNDALLLCTITYCRSTGTGWSISFLRLTTEKWTSSHLINLLLDQNARYRICREQQMASPLQKNTTAERQTSLLFIRK